MATTTTGPRSWSMERDDEGHRTYKVKYFVQSDLSTDGPAAVLATSGLPQLGDPYLQDGDFDNWATCRQTCTITPIVTNEPNYWWEIEVTFSTKPDEKRCKDQQIEDPLLIPDRLSGGFTRYTEEAAYNANSLPIINSALEQLRGPQVEFDRNRPSVKIEQNVTSLQLSLVSSLVDTVNDSPLWGLPPRCIKLSNVSWERKFYGSCYLYYTRNLEFEVRYPDPNIPAGTGGFDRLVMDEGSKALSGEWERPLGTEPQPPTGLWVLKNINNVPPNPLNPAHFQRFKDYDGNYCRVVLDGTGKPAGANVRNGQPGASQPGQISVVKYLSGNFLLLGIPTQLDTTT